MHFNILPGQHIIITSRHANPKFPPETHAATVVFVAKDRILYHHPCAHNGLTQVKKSGNKWLAGGWTVLELTGPDGKDLLASGFVSE